MTISIHHKLKPFSHEKGQRYLIPGSTVSIQVYPTKILGFDLLDLKSVFEIHLDLHDFYKEFTSEVDFEKKHLRVFGKCLEGFIELKIFSEAQGLLLRLERFKGQSLKITLNGITKTLHIKDEIVLNEGSEALSTKNEHLFLGISKKQDLSQIYERLDLKEYLPYIFKLGSFLNLAPSKAQDPFIQEVATFSSLNQTKKKEYLEKLIYGFFKQGFIPCLSDETFSGLKSSTDINLSPLYLIKALYESLKSSLVIFENKKLKIMHGWLEEFVAGKLTHVEVEFGFIHLEWTKGFLRRLVLDVKKDTDIELVFSKKIKSYRIRKGKKIGRDISFFEKGIYHIDHFEA